MPASPITDSDFSALSYTAQFDAKLERLQAQLLSFYTGDIERFESPEAGYRMRAEFRIWHQGNELNYAMYKPGTKELFCIQEFPAASSAIQNLMPALLNHIRIHPVLRHKLFSVEFLSSKAGEMLITLIYHRPLDDKWEAAALCLQDELSIQVIGRSRKQKIVLGRNYIEEVFRVDGQDFHYQHQENSFTQPNAYANQCMLDWTFQQAKHLDGDLLELYCGNGNFTLPLAKHFRRILTTEISKTSIAALKWNLKANAITNVDHARLSAEEIVQALDGVRPFRRLAHLDLNAYRFSTVFVDPPRAGVDSETLRFLSRFENIIYVSCNPTTLIPNLAQLSASHSPVSAAAFDQFPFTRHLEVAVRLKRLY